MNKLLFLISLFTIIILKNSEIISQTFETGKTYHGFKLTEKRYIKEVNGECLLFEHSKSGGLLLKIASNDDNKTFMISFKTTPESDDGSPHIMEHCVLNGSKNFPVKSPFDVMIKGSLSTFLNAFTSNDKTTYPVASMNKTDYFNLMHIYLDAVFNPMIYEDPRILKQEGWHYELTDKDAPITYKGIVYNEMKGAYSSPTRELDYQIMKILFPDIFYKYSSGGYPSAIPELTYDKFKAFHKKYYHPSNSIIVLYGNADINEELKFIDREYLSKYEKSDSKITYPLQKPFSSMKEGEGTYSVTEGSPVENQTYITLNFVTGQGNDRKLSYALQIISEVLVTQETAPIRKAFEEAGIGKEVDADISILNQNVFSFATQDANPSDKDKFKKIIFEKLNEAVKNGLDKEAVEGSLNRIEFRTRELNNAQLGLRYGMTATAGWSYANDPLIMLEYEKVFEELRKDIKNGYLESIIKQYFLNNNHALLYVLKPEPGLEGKKNAETEKKLKEFKEKLSTEEINALVKETEELIRYQKEENSKEALATIPLLDLKDIDKKAKFSEIEKDETDGITVYKYTAFTNNVVYYRQMFDMRVLPKELLPYASLLKDILGDLNTSKHTYGEIEKELNINTGGFSARLATYLENRNDDNLLPVFTVESKSINSKAEKMTGLVSEIISESKFEDKERLKSLLTRLQSNYESSVKSNGYGYTITRLKSYFSNEGSFAEVTGGIDYYNFITKITEGFDKNSEEIISNLKKTADILFKKNNLSLFIVCSDDDYKKIKSIIIPNLQEGKKADFSNWNLKPEKKNEGFLTASKVQYVLMGYNYKKLGYTYNGKLRVLNQILQTDWLYNQIRVLGGAYGGGCSISQSGDFLFTSYRDPNLKKTIDNYKGTIEYLKNFNPDDIEMQRYIIGTISKLDMPYTPQQEGNRALTYYIEKIKAEDLQKERDEILSARPEDIKGFAGMIEDVLKQNYICVYGNESIINDNKDLFDNVLKITK